MKAAAGRRHGGRLLMGLGASALILLGLGWLIWTSAPVEPVREEVSAARPPRLERVTVDGLLEGRRQWTLEVRGLEEGTEVVGLEGIERGLFFRNGTPWITLTAGRGRWMTATNGLELEGEVQIDLVEGGHLETERVRWEGGTGLLVADTGVTATLGGDRVTADRMVASATTGVVELGGSVELTRPDGQRLRAQGARWLGSEQRLELVGEVDWFFPSLPWLEGSLLPGRREPHEEASG